MDMSEINMLYRQADKKYGGTAEFSVEEAAFMQVMATLALAAQQATTNRLLERIADAVEALAQSPKT